MSEIDEGRHEADGRSTPGPESIDRQADIAPDSLVPARGGSMPPMVGLGGSAGSIAALQAFFRTMPPDTGMVFVVVLHLAPDHASSLAELLARVTPMPVVQATDRQPVLPDHVYVIPPGQELATVDGCLVLTPLQTEYGRRVVVDLFFRSLADTYGPHAAAIVLSGGDGDGALGIKRIKERGGLTIAQDPDEAEHAGMPQSAIATGMVDWILRVTQMPERLVAYVVQERALQLPAGTGPLLSTAVVASPEESEATLREALAYLRTRTGSDFSCYKRATVLRRVARRMQVNGVTTLAEYVVYLRTHPGEAGALLQDLLISVTNFFRDRDAFTALEPHLAALFAGRRPDDAVRVWVPACATGEEAYSLAMLLLEHARQLDHPPALQVFACDLNQDAIAQARAGLYPETIVADVSEDRLRSFFIKEHRGYRVRRELREMVLFATHDLLKDAPFSRMDLVSCRNLLIYLNREAQARAFDIFHFALRPGGLLFLGSSESIEEGTSLFGVVDRKYRIFRHQAAVRVGLPMPTGPASLAGAMTAHERGGAPVHGQRFQQQAAAQAAEPAGISTLAAVHYRLLERLAPPSIVVTADHEIVHISERAGTFLRVAGGEPSTNLLRMAHPALRPALRTALARSAETAEAVLVAGNLELVDGVTRRVDVRVVPVPEVATGARLVLFETDDTQALDHLAVASDALAAADDATVRQLELELEVLRQRMRDTADEHDVSSAEMKASNEELQAMNEELRSATEELETSREELQSINEELTTVNAEMRTKVEELAHTNSDLQNLMASTSIATVFLDRELAITRYTPTAVALFHLIPTDVGRPLGHLKHRLEYPEILADAEAVLRTLVPSEREVSDGDHWFLARLQPYRTVDDRIAGVVIALVDVTDRKRIAQAMQAQMEELTRFNAVAVGREMRMIELKREVNALRLRLGESAAYPLTFDHDDEEPAAP